MTIKAKKKHHVSLIKSIPHDLYVEILARVASSSYTDLFNARISCKDFDGASQDNYVFENVSIDKIPRILWTTNDMLSLSFLNRCQESGNAEALYREGMVEFFSSMKQESGLRNLKRAAEKGHPEALYVYGIVLLCSNNAQLKQRGLKLLSSLKSGSRKGGLSLNECRKRVRKFVWSMWVNNTHLVPGQQSTCCQTKDYTRPKRGWTLSDDEDDDHDDDNGKVCGSCKWNNEVTRFCNLLRRQRF